MMNFIKLCLQNKFIRVKIRFRCENYFLIYYVTTTKSETLYGPVLRHKPAFGDFLQIFPLTFPSTIFRHNGTALELNGKNNFQ